MRISAMIRKISPRKSARTAAGLPLVPKAETPQQVTAAFKRILELEASAIAGVDQAVTDLGRIGTQLRIIGKSKLGKDINQGPNGPWFQNVDDNFNDIAHKLYAIQKELEQYVEKRAGTFVHLSILQNVGPAGPNPNRRDDH